MRRLGWAHASRSLSAAPRGGVLWAGHADPRPQHDDCRLSVMDALRRVRDRDDRAPAAPTARSFPEPDAVRCTVGGIELFCNAADANLGFYSLLTARLVKGRDASWSGQPTPEN